MRCGDAKPAAGFIVDNIVRLIVEVDDEEMAEGNQVRINLIVTSYDTADQKSHGDSEPVSASSPSTLAPSILTSSASD